MSRLQVRGLAKAFGSTPVLDHLDLDVPSGCVGAVLGPSGCGKTTLLRVIAGFESADAGSVQIDDRVLADARTHLPPERRGVGMVPQEGALFPHLDVEGNVAFGLARSDPHRRERIGEVLDLVGLRHLARRRPSELSGGQQQRVALARALAPRPAVVLLDEPFSALDATLRAVVREEVRDVLAAAGATALLVTHDQDEALSTADVVAVMDAGRVRQIGSPAAVYHDPADATVALSVGEASVVPAQAGDGAVSTPLGHLRLRLRDADARGDGHALVRPEQLRLRRPDGGNLAQVVAVRFHGHDTTVRLLLADGTAVTCRTQDPVPAGEWLDVEVVGDASFFSSLPRV